MDARGIGVRDRPVDGPSPRAYIWGTRGPVPMAESSEIPANGAPSPRMPTRVLLAPIAATGRYAHARPSDSSSRYPAV
jgi:hypothetical protein